MKLFWKCLCGVLQGSTLSICQTLWIVFRLLLDDRNKKLCGLVAPIGCLLASRCSHRDPLEKCPHPLIWGLWRPVPFPKLPLMTPLTWAWPEVLVPFGLFRQDFSQLLLQWPGGTQLRPCPAQWQKFPVLFRSRWGVANLLEKVLLCERLPGSILTILLFYFMRFCYLFGPGRSHFLGWIVILPDEMVQMLLLSFAKGRESCMYTDMRVLSHMSYFACNH